MHPITVRITDTPPSREARRRLAQLLAIGLVREEAKRRLDVDFTAELSVHTDAPCGDDQVRGSRDASNGG